MLKPLKDLLTYLQRNANSSNLFGLTTPTNTMGPNENPRLEETIIVSDDVALEEGGDPLHDPLALDDCPSTDCLNVSGVSLPSEDDGDGISPDKIILVDVSTLKSKEQQEQEDDELATDDDEDIVVLSPVTETVAIEEEEAQQIVELLNSSTEASLELETSENNLLADENEVAPINGERSPPCVSDTFAVVEDGVRLSSSPSLADESETVEAIQLLDDCTDAVDAVQDGSRSSERTGTVETTAEQLQGTNGEEEEEASDGSDSGLGLEPVRTAATCDSSSTSSTNNSSSISPLQRPPIKSSLKRRSEPLMLDTTRPDGAEDGASSQKRPKKGISFDGVTVYYFPRIQGFGCVPSQGGCTLGMEFQHVHSRRLTLSEHSAEQRKVHRQQLQELNPRSSSSEDTSSEEEPSESGSEAESESYGFLQPVSTRQRRALLKAAGVRKIDPTEKDDCRVIRTSREVCGCTCRGFCDPNRCACSLAGIKCQVDRPNFPCGCTHEGCANTAGRVEFNPGRVRTHFLHTIMKLSMEREEGKGMQPGSSSSGVSIPPRPGGITTGAASDTTSGSYVIGSEKNWSNGPVRLPPSGVVGYGAGMHAGPSAAVHDMADGIGSIHQVPGMLPHHSNSLQPLGNHLAHHQPPMVLEDGMHHSPAGVHHHLSHQSAPYHNHLGVDHQNYLPAQNSNVASHLVGAAGPPPTVASSDSLNLHYPYRDYYEGIEGGAVGERGHSAGMPGMHHHLPSSSASTDPSVTTLHANMYYTANYGSFQEAGASTSAPHLDPYRQNPMVPLHPTPNADSTAVLRQHLLTTGHDRQMHGTSSFDGHFRSDHMPAFSEKERAGDASCAPGVLPQVPQQVVNSAEATVAVSLDVAPSSTNISSNGPIVRSLPSANVVSDPEDCDLNVTVISDSSRSMSDLDSSGDVTIVEPEPRSREDCVIVDDEDDNDDDVVVTGCQPGRSVDCPVTDFIDLETPQADNAERLEAINDLLKSSRNTLNIVRRSIVAEEDDELRDFQHPPVEPAPSRTICFADDEVDVVCEDRVTRSSKPANARVNEAHVPARSVNGGLPALTNGSNRNGREERHQKRVRCPTVGEDSGAILKKIVHDSSEEVSFVSSYTQHEHVPAEVSSASSLMASSTVVSSLASTTLEPSENLCEIIKNSIVETAVSH